MFNKPVSLTFKLASLAALLALGACASKVSLDETKPEGATAAAQGGGAQASAGGGATAGAVSQVDLTGRQGAGAVAGSPDKSVFFEYDSFVIREDDRASVEAHARFLKANPARKAALEGHTDERGSSEYNLALGQKRAESVRRALGVLGVPENQTEPVSFGKEKPRATGATESAWSQNRRVDVGYR